MSVEQRSPNETPRARCRVVLFTGAGMSAESGLPTFRDSGGLWYQYSVQEIATPEAWRNDPQLVLKFYNDRRANMRAAEPNPAHRAVAALESHYQVTVITQNIDDLHERAGSTHIIHLHGELRLARSSQDPSLLYPCPGDIQLGDQCELGSQLRPHVVWFGETVENMIEATRYLKLADKVVVVGTSLTVHPAAGLIRYVKNHAEKYIVAPELDFPPVGFTWLRGRATEHLPVLVAQWLATAHGNDRSMNSAVDP